MGKKVIFTPSQIDFIENNKSLLTNLEMAKALGVSKTFISKYRKENGLSLPKDGCILRRSLANSSKVSFTPDQDAFIVRNYLLLPVKTLAAAVGRSNTSLNRRLKQLNLEIPPEIVERNKQQSRIKPGTVPPNKGKKQTEYMSLESIERTKATRFKKGSIPHNAVGLEVGDIKVRTNKDKYGIVRRYKWIRHGLSNWEMLHVYNWEKAFGKIPDGHIVVFKNKDDTMNCEVSNLEIITLEENMRRNSIHRYDPSLRDLMRITGKIKSKIKKLKKQNEQK